MRALKVGAEFVSWSENVWLTPPADAVSVSVWAEVTAETFALKAALVDPGETVTFDGTVTAEPLLDRVTTTPLLGAAPLNVTEHESVPAAE